MRVIGWCVYCHKFKRVRVRPSKALSRAPMGECDACVEEREKRRATT